VRDDGPDGTSPTGVWHYATGEKKDQKICGDPVAVENMALFEFLDELEK